MKLLLDTHAFVWLATDISKLSAGAQQLLSTDSIEVYLSVASVWEMSIKVGLGKLQLGKPLATLVSEHQQVNSLQLLPVQANHAFAVEQLFTPP